MTTSHRRTLTVLDWALMIGAPLLTYFGSVISGHGNFWGLILAGAGTLATASIRAVRLARPVEPPIAHFTGGLSIGVSVFGLVSAVSLWREAPVAEPALYLIPLVPIVAFVIYLVLLLRVPATTSRSR